METESMIQSHLPAVTNENIKFENVSVVNDPTSSKTHDISETSDDCLKPFHSRYPDERVFNLALELFNKKMGTSQESSTSSNVPVKWEWKGKIRASFQMCILCKDVGKVRSQSETYYLDVLEIRKYRTILCQGCLGYILHKYVGNSMDEIEAELQEIQC